MKQRQKYRFKWFRVVLVLLIAYFCYQLANQQLQMAAIDRETAAAEIKLVEAQKRNTELVEERTKLNDKAYVEKLAREELGLVKPGETPYVQGARQ